MSTLDQYDFTLPQDLIAKEPVHPRESARLFVYDTATDTVVFDSFANLNTHLPERSMLIMNDTKVVPARLWLKKPTGGKIEVVLMMNEYRPGDIVIKGIVDRKIDVGTILSFQSGDTLTVDRQEEQFFFFRPSVTIPELYGLLQSEGVTPIPPYIKESPLDEQTLRSEYQSVLAKYPASVAAPTASLHFTEALLEQLTHHGKPHTEVTLHVGAGTFAPIDEHNFETKQLFTEYYEITPAGAERINTAKRAGSPIIPVGTTAMRTIESAAKDGVVQAGSDHTNIFIYPPYEFQIADALITNFHVPRSSLLLLVDALLAHKEAERRILDLYAIAIAERFRFYSFGDGMLIR
jgi:S-adenosylmethionine:tRNA ribosyltransferase-isomerase